MNKTVLIVEDFANSRFVIELTVKRIKEVSILTAANGYEALKLLDGRKVDLVVTDLNMPQMDGNELTKFIRQMPAYKNIPVIMLTTEKDAIRKNMAYKAGVTALIQKPFETEGFIKTLQKALGV